MKKKLLALLVVGTMSLSMTACGGSSDSGNTTQTSASAEATDPADLPATDAAEEQTPEEDPNVPTEYKSALRSAKTYSEMMHMSKQGIYDQLTSEYGDKFPAEAAQYAVDNMTADWNANALASAESYSDTMHMSKQGIYDQLTSEYGDKFNAEEAQYAIDNIQADWNANALASAQSYQETMAMSHADIYDQLTSDYGEKFTAEEAQYAVDNLD